MVTQFHTLLHFVTLFPLILCPTASVAASIRKPGVSKSHLLSDFHGIYAHTQAIAAGPMRISALQDSPCVISLDPPVYGSLSSVTDLLVLCDLPLSHR